MTGCLLRYEAGYYKDLESTSENSRKSELHYFSPLIGLVKCEVVKLVKIYKIRLDRIGGEIWWANKIMWKK